MKTRSSSVWMYTALAALVLSVAACGNSQKKKEKAAEKQMATQPMDTVTVIESETVIMIDSLAPDSTAVKNNTTSPKKTK